MNCARCKKKLSGYVDNWAKSAKDGKSYLVCDACFAHLMNTAPQDQPKEELKKRVWKGKL